LYFIAIDIDRGNGTYCSKNTATASPSEEAMAQIAVTRVLWCEYINGDNKLIHVFVL
jgi:hypothetical protein